jgi:hypothetical protein
MKTPGFLIGYVLWLVSSAAYADRLQLPADSPPAYQAECGSCHLAFPPQLLGVNEWQQVMAKLDKHYGDNASLDEKTHRLIEDYLTRHAVNVKRYMQVDTATPGELPRITASFWFKREHGKVSAATWKHAKVKSPANCTSCHTKADEGSYSEREIVMPRPWE